MDLMNGDEPGDAPVAKNSVKVLDWGRLAFHRLLKLLLFRTSFRQEVAVWHMLDHPNVAKNLRPEIPRCCSSSLASVMRRCWDANPERRPDMDEVVRLLEGSKGEVPEDQAFSCLCFGMARGP